MATVALCMIVKDEAEVIDRCLASALPYVDAWVICDTGSTDDTPARIEAAMGHLPGTLHHRAWVDFGHNRTELLERARGVADYLLLLDADWTVDFDDGVPELDEDIYLMRHAGDLGYTIPGLVRGDRAWKYERAVHEYLTADEPHNRVSLPGFWFQNHGDGADKATRFERNLRLLEAEWARLPDDPRTAFYLAETHRDLGHDDEALRWFRRRVALGGWDEEVFRSLHQIGVLLLRTDEVAGRAALLDAWQFRPGRIEPLVDLARHHRQRGEHHLAHLYALRAHQSPYPTDDLLFVGVGAWRWEAAFELSIASWWVGDRDRSLELSEQLLAAGGLAAHVEAFVRLNRQYGLEHRARHVAGAAFDAAPSTDVPCLLDLVTSTRITQIEVPIPPRCNAHNPAIATDGAGFLLLLRATSCKVVDGQFVATDDDGVVRTYYQRLRLDPVFGLRDRAPVEVTSGDQPPRHPARLEGLEDLRVVRVDGRWVGVATVRDRNPDSRCDMAVLTFEGEDATVVRSLRLLDSPRPGRDEKNWMPFVLEGALHAVYGLDPLVILTIDPGTGATTVLLDELGPPEARTWRGGTNGTPFDDGYLFVVHEIGFVDGRRRYRHRFVTLGADLRPTQASAPFSLAGQAIEFASGLAILGDHAVIAAGIEEEHPLLLRLPTAEVRTLLRPLG